MITGFSNNKPSRKNLAWAAMQAGKNPKAEAFVKVKNKGTMHAEKYWSGVDSVIKSQRKHRESVVAKNIKEQSKW